MYFSNLPTIIRMVFNPRIIKFFFKLYKLTRRDPSFKLRKLIVFLKTFLSKEKIVYHDKQYVINSLTPPIPSEAFLNFINGYQTKDSIVKNIVHNKRQYPLSTYIKITDKCNFDCIFCSAKFNSNKQELSVEKWINVVKKLNELNTAYIGITGGEPLLVEGLEKVIEVIDKRRFSILFTNGSNLTLKKAKELKKAGLFALSVSLDSHDEKTHNGIRRNEDAYQYALEAIKNSRKAGLYTIVQSVIFKQYLDKGQIYKLCRLVKKSGAHEIRIHKPVFSGALVKDKMGKDFLYNEEDLEKLYLLQDAVNKKIIRYPKVSSFPFTEGPKKFGCTAGTLHTYISETGEVTPCDFIPLSFGNVLKEDLKTIYKRMAQAMCFNKNKCLGEKINSLIEGKSTPLQFKDSLAVLEKIEDEDPVAFIKRLNKM